MTKITEVKDKSATVAWSPVSSHPDILALGTKDSGGIGFDDYGGELDLYDLNIANPDGSSAQSPSLLGSIKTTSRFSSIGWTPGSESVVDRFRMGLLAGGMMDGIVHVWNPQALLNGEENALIASINQHEGGAVKALKFNTLVPNQMASGGSDGQVLITSLDSPTQPQVTLPGTEPSTGAQVTQLDWNSQVAHIIASAASDGTATVWDLKSQRPWCKLQAESSGVAVSDLAWNPSQGLHMVTASADDRNPLLKLWDLRASTTMPLATLSGHSQGILSVAWCPHDDTLLLSCGKDNRTILWDLHSMRPIADIPNDDSEAASAVAPTDQSSSSVFSAGGGLSSSQHRRYEVQWSPLKRGVVSTCSFDRKVQAHSMIGLATKCGRPPKWLKPSSGVSCGFGGSVVSFSSTNKVAKIDIAVEQPELAKASSEFETAVAGGDIIGFCDSMAAKAKQARDSDEARIWGFMRVIFEANAREQLLGYLGFHHDAIAQAANEYSEGISDDVASMSINDKAIAPMTKNAGGAVKEALLVGNFEAAVECCFRTGNLADALILASCGGAELWAKTQERYFEREEKKRPFLSIVSAVIHNKLSDLVAKSDPARWEETLAILSTYGQSEEFPTLCIALGDRLEEAGDSKNASLCYMCSLSLERAVRYWILELENANKIKGGMDLLALHEFVVKVTILLKAVEPSTTLEPKIADLFSTYAAALSEQGLLVAASQYCRGSSEESNILRDRLYRSRESPGCLRALGSAPEFPFSLTAVKKAPVAATQAKPQQTTRQPQAAASVASTQNRAAYQQQTVSQVSVQQSTPANELPAGWVALQDPSSGRTYYANQSTGQTTWEKPAAAPAAPVPAPAPAAYSVNQNGIAPGPTESAPTSQQQPTQQYPKANGAATPSKLVSKYGDGFVTSSSHPELAQQYGNIGTSNPYSGGERPGIASVHSPEAAPISGTFDPNNLELSAEHEPIKEGLMELTASLSAAQLTTSDKRQLTEGEKGTAVLLKRLARGTIGPQVVTQVLNMVNAIQSRDFASASAIQTGLVNTEWRDHKDWLKGIKFLIQLASKKLR